MRNEVRIEISTVCNYLCKLCPHSGMLRSKEIMPTPFFNRLVDKIMNERTDFGYLTFSGMGEPLLDRDILSKIRYAVAQGLAPIIVTNGSRLTPVIFSELQDVGTNMIRISFHAHSPHGYSQMHGAGSGDFENIRRNLDEIFRRKTRTKIGIYCVLENEEETDLLKRMWAKADILEIWRPHNWANKMKNRALQSSLKRTCGRVAHGPLQILVDGRVSACCFDTEGELTYGDLKRQTLDEIFNGKIYKSILLNHTTGDHDGTICNTCDQRNMINREALIYSSVEKNQTERLKKTSTTFDKIEE